MSRKQNKSLWLVLVVPAAVSVAAVGVVVINVSGGPSTNADAVIFVAQRGPLTISVTESGTIKPVDQRILKSQVEGQTTILYLVPEGRMVEKGELLVELDASKLQDEKVGQLIRVQNSEAAFIRARENLEVVKSQGKSDVVVAKLDYRFSQEDLKQYLEGEYPTQLKELESKITLAKEELAQAAEEAKWSLTLLKEKYISGSEHKQHELTHKRVQLEHELAVANRNLLRNYTYKRKVVELKSNVGQTKMALDRTIRKARADNVQAEAELKAKDAEFKQQQNRLSKNEQQIEKTKIPAPIAGMVVYATSAKGSWRGNAEPLDEGQSVRERQELIYLPTADEMMAEIKVHESVLNKVNLGLPVKMTIDALPGRSFMGRVSKISPLHDAASMWMNPDLKVYTTQIILDGSHRDLRTGMSCQAQIIVDVLDDALYVPVQAVVRVGNQPTVYVRKDDVVEQRTVELGQDNNRMAHIIGGLEEGESVLLTPPLSAAIANLNNAEEGQTPDMSDREAKSGAIPDGDAHSDDVGRGDGEHPSQQQQGSEGRHQSRGEGKHDGRRERLQNMTPEQREQMRKRFQNITPAQRE